jgi:hypothetical protein
VYGGVAAPLPESAPAAAARRRRQSVGYVVTALLAAGLGAAGLAVVRSSGDALRSGLLVASEPTGATVEVDGRVLAETTPTAVHGLAVGAHTLKLRKQGHSDLERRVELHAGERALVEVALPAQSRAVEVKTAPSGATIYLDGRLVVGTTPTTVTLTDDDFHIIRAERTGYETLTYNVKPEDRQSELLLTLETETEPRGLLSVDANEVAEVWVDGVYTAFNTPTIAFHVRAGQHTVQLHGTGDLRGPPVKVNLHQGEHQYLLLSLNGGSGK